MGDENYNKETLGSTPPSRPPERSEAPSSKSSQRDSVMKKLTVDISGPAAIPRKNGELLFQAPWESRAFGIAIMLHKRGFFDWEEFRQGLIAEIAAWGKEHSPMDAGWSYYERWLSSLEKLLVDKGLLSREEMTKKVAQVKANWKHDDEHESNHFHP